MAPPPTKVLEWRLEPAWSPPQTSATHLSPVGHMAKPPELARVCNANLVTLGVLYYNDPAPLRLHFGIWAQYPASVQSRFEFVVIDDGSSEHMQAHNVLAQLHRLGRVPLSLSILRVRRRPENGQNPSRALGWDGRPG